MERTTREQESTYMIQNRADPDEMHRLDLQDTLLTQGMGGVLPELADAGHLRRVLDVGCGTGGWLREMARQYPTIEKLFGADISATILAYARAKTEEQHREQRVRFETMDALRLLEFAKASFDLVNQRLGVSWLRTWEWKKILYEFQRVLRAGGRARITETEAVITTNSPALAKLGDISLEAFHRSGRLFSPTSDGITGHLAALMKQYGFEDIETHPHTITLQAGTPACRQFSEDIVIGYRVALPFFQKWAQVPGDYQEIYQQAKQEMQSAEFEAKWTLLTVCGTKPMDGQRLIMRRH